MLELFPVSVLTKIAPGIHQKLFFYFQEEHLVRSKCHAERCASVVILSQVTSFDLIGSKVWQGFTGLFNIVSPNICPSDCSVEIFNITVLKS